MALRTVNDALSVLDMLAERGHITVREVANELSGMLAGDEQMLDLAVAPREPVIGSDMIQRKLGSRHADS